MLSKAVVMGYLPLVTSSGSYALHSVYNTLFARLQEHVPRACTVMEREASMGHTYDFVTQEAVAFDKFT
jgi:hypothetical protein